MEMQPLRRAVFDVLMYKCIKKRASFHTSSTFSSVPASFSIPYFGVLVSSLMDCSIPPWAAEGGHFRLGLPALLVTLEAAGERVRGRDSRAGFRPGWRRLPADPGDDARGRTRAEEGCRAHGPVYPWSTPALPPIEKQPVLSRPSSTSACTCRGSTRGSRLYSHALPCTAQDTASRGHGGPGFSPPCLLRQS